MSGEIISHALWLQKEGYRRSTILSAVSCLKSVAKKANLLNPESVKRYLGAVSLTESRKEAITVRLSRFYRQKGITWNPPRYRRVERLPWIPTEEEVNLLIGGMGKKTATFLQLLKETGMRPGEAWGLQWKDVDTERRTVSVTPEKNSNPRSLKISERLLSMFNSLPKFGAYVFHATKADPILSLLYFRRGYERRRKRLAQRLQNLRMPLFSFETVRGSEKVVRQGHAKLLGEIEPNKEVIAV